MKKQIKQTVQIIGAIIFTLQPSLALAWEAESYSDKLNENLVKAFEETYERIEEQRILVEDYEVVEVQLTDEEGNVICRKSPDERFIPSFMSAGKEEIVSDVPECDDEALDQLQKQGHMASLGEYGGNKQAALPVIPIIGVSVYKAYNVSTCVAGVYLGARDGAEDLSKIGGVLNEVILIQEDDHAGTKIWKISSMLGVFGKAVSVSKAVGSSKVVSVSKAVAEKSYLPAGSGMGFTFGDRLWKVSDKVYSESDYSQTKIERFVQQGILATFSAAIGFVIGAVSSTVVGPAMLCGNATYLFKENLVRDEKKSFR